MSNVSMIDGHIDEPKMTDEDIIKALGLCTSKHLGCEDGCPRRNNGLTFSQCRSVLQKDALSLINRL